MKVQSVQPTPNPNAFKFILAERVIAHGVRNYTAADEAKNDPLGAALFGISGVDTLFFCDNFITVSMLESADWRAVHDEVVKVLDAHEGQAIAPSGGAAPSPEGAAAPTDGAEDPDLLERITALLDDRVRPALAGDGGGLEILGLQGKTLTIRYQGACGSCPSSVAGTLVAIQNLIQDEVDDAVEVVSA